MNKRQLNAMNKCNILLEKNNQQIRVILWSDVIILDNNIQIKNKSTFRKHINGKKCIGLIDLLYSINQDDRLKGKKLLYTAWNKGLTKETDGRVKEYSKKLIGKVLSDNTKQKISTSNKGKPCWCKGLTKETNKSLKKLSEDRMGKGNPMYGVVHSDEYKKRVSDKMKENIRTGKFTPNIHNSRTHWQSTWKNKKYRSSWEAVFHSLNPLYKFEKLRIEYILNKEKHIYIVDFIDESNRIVVEIKPKSMSNDKKTIKKEKSLIKWCKENGYTYKMINEDYFHENWNKINFDEFDNETYNRIKKVYDEINKKKKNR